MDSGIVWIASFQSSSRWKCPSPHPMPHQHHNSSGPVIRPTQSCNIHQREQERKFFYVKALCDYTATCDLFCMYVFLYLSRRLFVLYILPLAQLTWSQMRWSVWWATGAMVHMSIFVRSVQHQEETIDQLVSLRRYLYCLHYICISFSS